MTTTETESIEALHLWLATELPELQRRCPGINGQTEHEIGVLTPTWEACPHRHGYEPSINLEKDPCQTRGWVPNVSTDALLEVLRGEGYYVEIRGWVPAKVRELPDLLEDNYCGRVSPNDEQLHGDEVEAWGSTPNVALCRAARKALEAAS